MTLPVLHTGGKLAAIVPQSFEDVQRLAMMAVRAGLGPRDRSDDEHTAVAKCTAAILQGLECDIPPLQALQGIAVINGRAVIWGELLVALLWSKGFKVAKTIEGEGDARCAVARITRPDGEVIEKRFSVADAKHARLWKTAQDASPWSRFPMDMLGWKAFGRAVRDGAADVTHGMTTREDMDNPIVDVTPVQAARIEPPEPPDPDAPIAKAMAKPDPDPEPIAEAEIVDPEKVMAQIVEQAKACPADERAEFWAMNADTIESLPKSIQAKLAAMREADEPGHVQTCPPVSDPAEPDDRDIIIHDFKAALAKVHNTTRIAAVHKSFADQIDALDEPRREVARALYKQALDRAKARAVA